MVRSWRMPSALVRPPRPDVDGAADLEHVAAVEGARWFDAPDGQPEVAHGVLDRRGLARRDSAPGLVMTAVSSNMTTASSMNTESGMVRRGRHLDRLPAVVDQGLHVAVPLVLGEVGVDRSRARCG